MATNQISTTTIDSSESMYDDLSNDEVLNMTTTSNLTPSTPKVTSSNEREIVKKIEHSEDEDDVDEAFKLVSKNDPHEKKQHFLKVVEETAKRSSNSVRT